MGGLGGNASKGKGNRVQMGESFSKMGVYAKKLNIKVNWGEFSEHGFEQMEKRGVTKDMVNAWVKNVS